MFACMRGLSMPTIATLAKLVRTPNFCRNHSWSAIVPSGLYGVLISGVSHRYSPSTMSQYSPGGPKKTL